MNNHRVCEGRERGERFSRKYSCNAIVEGAGMRIIGVLTIRRNSDHLSMFRQGVEASESRVAGGQRSGHRAISGVTGKRGLGNLTGRQDRKRPRHGICPRGMHFLAVGKGFFRLWADETAITRLMKQLF